VKAIATVLHRKGQLAPGKIPSATLPKLPGQHTTAASYHCWSAPDHSGLKAAAFATVRRHCLHRARSTASAGLATLASRR